MSRAFLKEIENELSDLDSFAVLLSNTADRELMGQETGAGIAVGVRLLTDKLGELYVLISEHNRRKGGAA